MFQDLASWLLARPSPQTGGYLPTRQAIQMFANHTGNAKGFPTEEFLVTLQYDVAPPEPEQRQPYNPG